MARKKVSAERVLSLLTERFELDLELYIDEEGGLPSYATYIVLFQEKLLDFACDRSMNRSTLRVVMYLLGKMSYGNRIEKSQVQIAEALNMQPSLVSKAIKLLIDTKVIVHSKKERLFYLNPRLGWRGSIEEYDNFVRKDKFEKVLRNEYVDEEEKEMNRRFIEKICEEEKRLRDLEDLVI